MEIENWDLYRFRQKLEIILNNEYLAKYEKDLNFPLNLETEILAIPLKGESVVFNVRHNKIQSEISLSEYKLHNQIENIDDLFFSKQTLKNEEIDYEYQRNLLANFKYILNLSDTELNLNIKLHIQVKQLIKLVANAMGDQNKELYRSNIGGDFIFCAYSFDRKPWENICIERI